MPQVQVVDTTENKPEPTGIQEFFSKLGKSYRDEADRIEIGKILDEYKANREDANAWEDLQLNLEKSNISPSKRLETQKSLNEMRKLIIEKDKALNSKVSKGIKSQEDRQAELQRLINDGYPEEEAEIYVDSPPGVKASLERNHRMEKARRVRKSPGKNNISLPNPESLEMVEETGLLPTKSPVIDEIEEIEWPDLPSPINMTHEERIKWGNNNEKTNI